MPMGKFQEDLCLRESVPLNAMFDDRMTASERYTCQAPDITRNSFARENYKVMKR